MTRRELRENTFKMLFRMEFHAADEMPEQLQLFEEELRNPLDEEEKRSIAPREEEYLTRKCSEIFAHVGELDGEINRVSSGWKTSRMSKADLTILRLAVYEMRFEEDIPVPVSINEAVELAKKYGTDDSASFVNGILAKLV